VAASASRKAAKASRSFMSLCLGDTSQTQTMLRFVSSSC
jgi:hypothetical protein